MTDDLRALDQRLRRTERALELRLRSLERFIAWGLLILFWALMTYIVGWVG